MKESLLSRSIKETLPDMGMVLAGWGGGLVLMGLYCLIVWVLYVYYGRYVMSVIAILLLVLIYFVIDWSYRYQYEKKLHSMNKQDMEKMEVYFGFKQKK